MIEAYVAVLAGLLAGPKRAKNDLLAEARDSMVDSAEAYQRKGLCWSAAERRAVAEFGGVDEVARAYQSELGVAQSRRTAMLIILVLAPQGLIWGNTPSGDHGPLVALLDSWLSWIGALAIAGSTAVTLATGFGQRYLRLSRQIPRAVGLFGLYVAGSVSVCSVLLAALSGEQARGVDSVPLALVVVVAPMTLVAVFARRTLAAAT